MRNRLLTIVLLTLSGYFVGKLLKIRLIKNREYLSVCIEAIIRYKTVYASS